MNSFKDFDLGEPLQRAIDDLGYEAPSAIQAQALPILLSEPTDFIGQAATGSGKTAAFTLPMLKRIDPSLRRVQALIMCPTRELALQVTSQVQLLGKYLNIRTVTLYGGSSFADQERALRQGASIVVGTPGRILDHIRRETMRLDQVRVTILDEADEMMSMGFQDDMEAILSEVPRDQGSRWLFSATMSKEVRKVVEKFLKNPKQVQGQTKSAVPQALEQFYYLTNERNKPEILCKLIEAADDFYGIVFCQTKNAVTELTHFLMERKYQADCLHGDRDQTSREKTLQAFRKRQIRILVCTDVASRGLDVKDVTHVINYSLPRETENYVHRIGRTGRFGKAGIAMSLVTPSHRHLIRKIENVTKTPMNPGVLPTRKDIGIKKVSALLNDFSTQRFHHRAIEVMGEDWKLAVESMTPVEVAGHFLAMMMPDLFNDRDREEKPRSLNSHKPRQLADDLDDADTGRSERSFRKKKSFRSKHRGGGGGGRFHKFKSKKRSAPRNHAPAR